MAIAEAALKAQTRQLWWWHRLESLRKTIKFLPSPCLEKLHIPRLQKTAFQANVRGQYLHVMNLQLEELAKKEQVTWLKSICANEETLYQEVKSTTEEKLATIIDVCNPLQMFTLKQKPNQTPMELYIEKWRVLLQKKAYVSFFRCPNPYLKPHPLIDEPRATWLRNNFFTATSRGNLLSRYI